MLFLLDFVQLDNNCDDFKCFKLIQLLQETLFQGSLIKGQWLLTTIELTVEGKKETATAKWLSAHSSGQNPWNFKFYCSLLFSSFQFVVSDSGDYEIHAMDPDVLVDWDLIEQVVSSLHQNFYNFFLKSSDKCKNLFMQIILLMLSIYLDLFSQRILSHEVPSCPICLYPPVAGRCDTV